MEPIVFKRGQIIINELDSVEQIFFFMKGNIDIGYEINRIVKYKIRFRGSVIIGGFECSFNRRSQAMYKANTESNGYMIRKNNWKDIKENFVEFYY